jgi:3-(3-hydroxy-phenyl)propionate hydroxylase
LGEVILLDDLLHFRFLIATSTGEAQAWLTPESRALWRRLEGERIVIGPPLPTAQPQSVAGDDVQYLAETDALFAEWMSQHGCAAVVVRPDRYVFGTAGDAAQLNRLVAAVGRHVSAP